MLNLWIRSPLALLFLVVNCGADDPLAHTTVGTGDESDASSSDASGLGAGGHGDASAQVDAATSDASENADGAPDATLTKSFVHPGCLSTQQDLERMKSKVDAKAEPWKGSWALLEANSHAQPTYQPNPQVSICAGGPCMPENYMPLAHDAAAAYQLALRYRISGDRTYGARAAFILDSWASKLTAFEGDSNAGLRAALYGYQLACAGELLRGLGDWDSAPLRHLLTDVFYPIHADFLARHNGACDSNYWANWDLANMASVMAIGVFTDRRDIFDIGVDYFREGVGEGSIEHAVILTPRRSGQWQESGRDQGHNTLGPMLMGVVCEIAWNQGIDLYGSPATGFSRGASMSRLTTSATTSLLSPTPMRRALWVLANWAFNPPFLRADGDCSARVGTLSTITMSTARGSPHRLPGSTPPRFALRVAAATMAPRAAGSTLLVTRR